MLQQALPSSVLLRLTLIAGRLYRTYVHAAAYVETYCMYGEVLVEVVHDCVRTCQTRKVLENIAKSGVLLPPSSMTS